MSLGHLPPRLSDAEYVCALIRAGRGAGDTVWAEIGRRIGLPESVVRWVMT